MKPLDPENVSSEILFKKTKKKKLNHQFFVNDFCQGEHYSFPPIKSSFRFIYRPCKTNNKSYIDGLAEMSLTSSANLGHHPICVFLIVRLKKNNCKYVRFTLEFKMCVQIFFFLFFSWLTSHFFFNDGIEKEIVSPLLLFPGLQEPASWTDWPDVRNFSPLSVIVVTWI